MLKKFATQKIGKIKSFFLSKDNNDGKQNVTSREDVPNEERLSNKKKLKSHHFNEKEKKKQSHSRGHNRKREKEKEHKGEKKHKNEENLKEKRVVNELQLLSREPIEQQLSSSIEKVKNSPVNVEKSKIVKLNDNQKILLEKTANEFANNTITIGTKGLKTIFETEFPESTPAIPPQLTTSFNLPENANQNRSQVIPCIESTRVILKDTISPTNYIHANYVSSVSNKKRMIITQAPMPTTIINFWRMIWQEQPEYIVMLCEFSDNPKNICTEYIPKMNGQIKFEPFTIINNGVERSNKQNDIIITKIVIKYKDKELEFTHVQWKNFPENGCPPHWELHSYHIYEMVKKSSKPIILHCRSGVRRSGYVGSIFICLDDFFKGTLTKDILPIVKNLRNERGLAVRTSTDYIFIHILLLYLFVTSNYISNSQTLMELFDAFEPENRKQSRKEKQGTCVSAYGLCKTIAGSPK